MTSHGSSDEGNAQSHTDGLAREGFPCILWEVLQGAGYTTLKGKCALGPFLSILVIECQRKCFCVDLCNVVDKVQIMSKGMFLDLVHYFMD
jgi:hypothetical protein